MEHNRPGDRLSSGQRRSFRLTLLSATAAVGVALLLSGCGEKGETAVDPVQAGNGSSAIEQPSQPPALPGPAQPIQAEPPQQPPAPVPTAPVIEEPAYEEPTYEEPVQAAPLDEPPAPVPGPSYAPSDEAVFQGSLDAIDNCSGLQPGERSYAGQHCFGEGPARWL